LYWVAMRQIDGVHNGGWVFWKTVKVLTYLGIY
jgi:hypothetical protein